MPLHGDIRVVPQFDVGQDVGVLAGADDLHRTHVAACLHVAKVQTPAVGRNHASVTCHKLGYVDMSTKWVSPNYFGKDNVILTLGGGGGGVRHMTFSHRTEFKKWLPDSHNLGYQ